MFLLTMSMTIFRRDCLCFLVRFWKMSQFSSCRSLKPTARWWFSSTDESLYISASSESVTRTWYSVTLWGCGFDTFDNSVWASKEHQNWNKHLSCDEDHEFIHLIVKTAVVTRISHVPRSVSGRRKAAACFPLRGFPTLGHLKVLHLYLDFPLRCISRSHSGAERQRGERGSCSAAPRLTEDHSGGS